MAKMARTTKFQFTIGTSAGYFHENSGATPEDIVADKYIEAAVKIQNETGIFVSAVVSPSRCCYRYDWGCPRGGEKTFTFEGVRNPDFADYDPAWREAVKRIVETLKVEFQQSTVTVEFSETEIDYLVD